MSKINFYVDKKQMPQVAVLGVLSVIMLGYFASKMATPPPAEHATAATITVATEKQKPVVTPIDTPSDDLCNGLAPTATMHDPFVTVAGPSPATNPAPVVKQHIDNPLPQSDTHVAPLQAMPSESGVKPLAGLNQPSGNPMNAQSTGPTWAVTGIICGATQSSSIAILRNGESRRFVALGQMVDDQYRLIGVDRSGVTLAEGKTRLRLNLGSAAAKDSGSKPSNLSAASAPADSTLAAASSSPATPQSADSTDGASSDDVLPELNAVSSEVTAQN